MNARISTLVVAGISMVLASVGESRADGLQAAAPPTNKEDNFDESWVTASSDHFRIFASGGARVARRALEEAERAVQALRLALTINGEFPDDRRQLTLVLFASADLYKQVAPARTAGFFRPATDWGDTDLVLLRGVGRFQILRHELVHRLMQPVLPKAPAWLAEGMAQYFQWTEIGETAITVGSSPETAPLQRMLHDSPFFPPLPDLLASPKSAFYGLQAHGLYGASFWLLSTLNSDAGYRKRFNEVLRAMAKGSPADVAWKRAFTTAETQAVDRDYRDSSSRSDPVSHRLDWHPATSEVSAVRPLDPAEAHVLLARLYGRARASSARSELDAAIQLDPQLAEAFALRSLFERDSPAQRRDDAERAVALDPGAPLVWLAMGLALLPPSHRVDGLRVREVARRLESFKDSAESHCLGAVLLHAVSDRRGALKLARRAVRIAPTDFRAHAVLSKLAADGHPNREAREARARAWALAPDGLDPKTLDLLLQR